jgi:hypothetical protein
MKTHVGQSYAWADRNGDGLTQPEELSFGPGDPKQRPFRHYYWGVLPDTDGTLAFVGSDDQSLVKFPIRSFTACGEDEVEVVDYLLSPRNPDAIAIFRSELAGVKVVVTFTCGDSADRCSRISFSPSFFQAVGCPNLSS